MWGWIGWRRLMTLMLLLSTPSMAEAQSTAAATAAPQAVQTPACARAEFEAVVDDAGEALRRLTQKNTPDFQARLRALKEKRGWSHEQFMAEGATYVRDDEIAGYDEKSATLLARINGAGGDVTNAGATDCARLAELKANMGALVELQNAKWAHMFGKIDAELAK